MPSRAWQKQSDFLEDIRYPACQRRANDRSDTDLFGFDLCWIYTEIRDYFDMEWGDNDLSMRSDKSGRLEFFS